MIWGDLAFRLILQLKSVMFKLNQPPTLAPEETKIDQAAKPFDTMGQVNQARPKVKESGPRDFPLGRVTSKKMEGALHGISKAIEYIECKEAATVLKTLKHN